MVKGAECRVQGAGCWLQGAGGRGQGSGFWAQGFGLRVQAGAPVVAPDVRVRQAVGSGDRIQIRRQELVGGQGEAQAAEARVLQRRQREPHLEPNPFGTYFEPGQSLGPLGVRGGSVTGNSNLTIHLQVVV